MSGRILTERLLATTSLAALILAGVSHQASALNPCTIVPAGGTLTNTGSVRCVEATSNAIGINNTSTGKIGSTVSAVLVDSGVTLSGGITNSGRIIGGQNGPDSASAIQIRGIVLGGITNNGTIQVSTTGHAYNYGAIAIGTPFGARVSSFAGGVTNSGTLSVTANGTSSTNMVLLANANTFIGNIINSGLISGTDTSSDDASMYGITVTGSIFDGNIVNAGTITVSAAGTSNSSGFAQAVGLEITPSTLIGNVINGGTIQAVASLANCCGSARATGIAVDSTLLVGSVLNSGTISVSSTVSNSICCGHAVAIGVDISVSTLNGGITNSGLISATANSVGNCGTARATGIFVSSGLVNGSIANTGTISVSSTVTNGGCCASAVAVGMGIDVGTLNGGVTNSGSIIAMASVTANLGAFATATGINLDVGTMTGGVLNSGMISATATATNCCGRANAFGIVLDVGTLNGGITNSGMITVSATMNPNARCGDAFAIGLSVDVGTINGGILNAGSIIATATNIGTADFNNATAIGVEVDVGTINGNIVNNGIISATASINGCGRAIAVGMKLLGTVNGEVINNGTIIAKASSPDNCGSAIGVAATFFSSTIINSGTIEGLITGGSGSGVGIAIFDGHGTIVNAGVIRGSNWGIELLNTNGPTTIDLLGGLVQGSTTNDFACGGAIRLSSHADVVNIEGGSIIGNIVGGNASATTGNVINVAMGGGTFSYAGIITNVGNVNVLSGTLLLQNSGNATAAGGTVNTTDYTQLAGGTLGIQVTTATGTPNGGSGTGSVNATNVTLAGNLTAYETDSPFAPGVTYHDAGVVNWTTLSGNFNLVNSNSPLFTASVTQVGNSDTLNVSLLPIGSVPGLSPNQRGVAGAIIGIPGGNATLDQIFELNGAQLGPVLTQLSGSQYTQTSYLPLLDAWQSFTDTLSNRLQIGQGYSGTMTGSWSPGSGIQIAQADAPVQQAQASDAGGMRFAAPVPHPWGAWMRGYGLNATAPSTATNSAFDEEGAGIIAGADKQWTDEFVAGVAINFALDKASSVGNGGSTSTNAYQGSVYGQYKLDQVDPNWYVDGIAGLGWQTYKSSRFITLITPTVDDGNYSGQSYRLYGESGYTLHPAFMAESALRVTPYLGVGYLHTHTDAFTENGPTALSVQAMDANSVTTTLGGRLAAIWQVGPALIQPELRAAWQHEWADAASTITAAFAQAPGSTFTATGTAYSRESFLGGIGVTLAQTEHASSMQVFLDYDAKVNGGYVANVVSGGLRFEF